MFIDTSPRITAQRQLIQALFGASLKTQPTQVQPRRVATSQLKHARLVSSRVIEKPLLSDANPMVGVIQQIGPVKSVDTPGATYLARGGYAIPTPSNIFSAPEYAWFLHHFQLAQPVVDQDFSKFSDMTAAYNCHQWALGNTNSATSPVGQTWDDFDQFFGPYGMERKTSVGGNTVIAVYGTTPTTLDHVAVKRTGGWVSKLGGGPLVHHQLNSLVGAALYGDIQGYYDLKF